MTGKRHDQYGVGVSIDGVDHIKASAGGVMGTVTEPQATPDFAVTIIRDGSSDMNGVAIAGGPLDILETQLLRDHGASFIAGMRGEQTVSLGTASKPDMHDKSVMNRATRFRAPQRV